MPLRFKILLLFLFFMLNAIGGSVFVRDGMTQPTTWQRIFGGPRDDYAYDFFQTQDGNYLMVGVLSLVFEIYS